MGGRGVFPPLPAGVDPRGGWKKNEDPAETQRRSVYTFVRRNTRYPMFEVFDMPDTHESCPRRNTTVTAPQALELLNNELVLDWSKSLAGKVLNDGGLTPEAQVDRAYRLTFSRTPTEAERKTALEFLTRQSAILAERMATDEKTPLPDNLPQGVEKGTSRGAGRSLPRAAEFERICVSELAVPRAYEQQIGSPLASFIAPAVFPARR